ncbi:MAG: hypothetical protein C4527_14100 [Candidatus Omnitrophota bacterium]|jgi:hypothetical protein|nr:MAG: hypothetical protein C4527_14100 [Candidatus Omnitrophota bacterium]
MKPDHSRIEEWYHTLSQECQNRLDLTVDILCKTKEKGGKIAVVTGSGPNLHEGVTTLIAELMRTGIVDGVTTSSAVAAHELGGVLDRVKRVNGLELDVDPALLPRGNVFEFTVMDKAPLASVMQDIPFNQELWKTGEKITGNVIIKAAGNMAYPMGLWIERMAERILAESREKAEPFEKIAGAYADPRTMIGQGCLQSLPVLVTIPQLVGGGNVGLAIGDSIPISRRARCVADLLESADVIIESGVALTQEIHDGPFETYTGHGIWAGWSGAPTFSLKEKKLIRIDLDPALDRAWRFERESKTVQEAIDKGLPKTKLMEIPFRMEMSGFARLEGSLPLIGDLGVIWPILAARLEQRLQLDLQFISAPQQTPEGQAMREWIAHEIKPITRVMEKSSERYNYA